MEKTLIDGAEHFRLPVYKIEGEPGEYAWADTDRKADNAARLSILDSLWAFGAGFLLDYIPGIEGHARDATKKALGKMQETLCEDAGPLIRAMLGENLEELVDGAIGADGRGQFLAGYDGEEKESTEEGRTSFYYRIN